MESQNILKCRFLGEIHHEELQIARDGLVREILSQLDKKYPDSCILLNNKLYQLQDDDVIDDVFEEGDVLTAVKSQHNLDRNAVVNNNSGDVVVLMDKNKQPIFVEPKNVQKWKWNPLNFFPTITVFRFVTETAPDMKCKNKALSSQETVRRRGTEA